MIFVWFPSYVGIIGNEIADQTANNGSRSGEFIDMILSIKEMYHLIEQKIKLQFREVELKPYKKYEYSVSPTSPTVYSSYRTRDTVYTKLRLKVNRLGAERYPQTNCAHCGIMATFDHIFFECPQYKDHSINFTDQLLRLEIPAINRCTLLFPE